MNDQTLSVQVQRLVDRNETQANTIKSLYAMLNSQAEEFRKLQVAHDIRKETVADQMRLLQARDREIAILQSLPPLQPVYLQVPRPKVLSVSVHYDDGTSETVKPKR